MLKKLEAIRAILTSDSSTLGQGALGWLWVRSPMLVPIHGLKSTSRSRKMQAHLLIARYL